MIKTFACGGCSVLMMAMMAGAAAVPGVRADDSVRTLTFDGVLSETKIPAKELNLPADWSDFTHLVMEMRTSSPQRFGLWIYTAEGLRRVEIQPFGENVWLRASIPLEHLKAMATGADLAAANNRRTNSFWMSVWGPFGELKSVEAIGFSMDYPIT